jgi:hypothetical protein
VHPLPMDTYRTVAKGHGRLEERVIRVSRELAGYSSWPYLEQVFEYTRTWTTKGVTKQQVRYGITSLPPEVGDAARLAVLKRGHGQVENALHYVKDVTLGEDASQTHRETARMYSEWYETLRLVCCDGPGTGTSLHNCGA